MNSSYRPPDMSQHMPGPPPAGQNYLPSVPPMHAYPPHHHQQHQQPSQQQQHQQQQQQQPLPPQLPPPQHPHPHHQHSLPPPLPPPTPSSQHPLQHQQPQPQQHQHHQLPPYSPHPSQHQNQQQQQVSPPHQYPPQQHLQHQAPQHQAPPPLEQQHQGPPPVQTNRPMDNSSTTMRIPQDVTIQPPAADEAVPLSKVEEKTGWKYSLDVVQQPRRARMCGFGDKDRRPITPPPCVRLVITNIATGKEVDYSELDNSMFVLSVDLWNEDGSRDVNLVRSSTSTASMPPFSVTAGRDLSRESEPSPVAYSPQGVPPSRESGYTQAPASVGYVNAYSAPQGFNQGVPSYGPPQQYFPQNGGYRGDAAVPPMPGQGGVVAPYRNGSQSGYNQEQHTVVTRMAVLGGQPQGMFTRNLIGSLTASAFRLSDTEDRVGLWFVLQDLSVRTEGPFRLRFSFVNVGVPGGLLNGMPAKVVMGRAPILASCFSDVFNVYSAKKFPGVCESTPLSKTFATQGIKIPIRKDTNVKGDDGEDDYE